MKLSTLLGPFVSYVENEGSWIKILLLAPRWTASKLLANIGLGKKCDKHTSLLQYCIYYTCKIFIVYAWALKPIRALCFKTFWRVIYDLAWNNKLACLSWTVTSTHIRCFRVSLEAYLLMLYRPLLASIRLGSGTDKRTNLQHRF